MRGEMEREDFPPSLFQDSSLSRYHPLPLMRRTFQPKRSLAGEGKSRSTGATAAAAALASSQTGKTVTAAASLLEARERERAEMR